MVNSVSPIEPGKGERAAEVRDVVAGTSSVKTGIKSRAELLFQDKTLSRLGANTVFSFDEGTRDLELEHGTMLLQVPKGVGSARIRTAAETAAITGTTSCSSIPPPHGLAHSRLEFRRRWRRCRLSSALWSFSIRAGNIRRPTPRSCSAKHVSRRRAVGS